MTSTINEENVSKLLNSNHFVAIKIEADSEPYEQFCEICMIFFNCKLVFINH